MKNRLVKKPLCILLAVLAVGIGISAQVQVISGVPERMMKRTDPNYDPYNAQMSNAKLKPVRINVLVLSGKDGSYGAERTFRNPNVATPYHTASREYKGEPDCYYTICFDGELCELEKDEPCTLNCQSMSDTIPEL